MTRIYFNRDEQNYLLPNDKPGIISRLRRASTAINVTAVQIGASRAFLRELPNQVEPTLNEFRWQYLKFQEHSTKLKCSLISLLLLALPIFSVTFLLPAEATRVAPRWEALVKKANAEFERGRYHPANRLYRSALAILERQGAYDIRLAIVMKDIGRVQHTLMNNPSARLWDGKAAVIYKHEIDTHQLGGEYSTTGTADASQRLRPACPVCHENFHVIPIHFGDGTGYEGPVPSESDVRFTLKPAPRDVSEERWYCKGCKQLF